MDTPTPPLYSPYQNCSYPVALQRFVQKWNVFSGRASRSEYWYVAGTLYVINVIMMWIVNLSSPQIAESQLSAAGVIFLAIWFLWGLIVAIPTLALTFRRFHDANLSAWWLLLVFTGIGAIFILVVSLLPSNPAGARFDKPMVALETDVDAAAESVS